MKLVHEIKKLIDVDPRNLWGKTISIKKNELITKKGEVENFFYLVKKGTVRITVEDENNE